jgi:hypothetical protein
MKAFGGPHLARWASLERVTLLLSATSKPYLPVPGAADLDATLSLPLNLLLHHSSLVFIPPELTCPTFPNAVLVLPCY